MTPLRFAVLASGGGSNLQAILDRISAGDLQANLVFAVSNNSQAQILNRARNAGALTYHVSSRTEGSEEAVASKLLELIEQHPIDLLVLAGYMKKVPVVVLQKMHNRVINIHPALLPEFGGQGFYGHHVHEAVVEVARAMVADGRYLTGMTIHMVNENYDEGQIVLQRKVDIYGDDADKVACKVLRLEHDSYWRVLKAFSEGEIVPTDSDDPAEAVRIDPKWIQQMQSLS